MRVAVPMECYWRPDTFTKERKIKPKSFWDMYPFLAEKYVNDGRLKITLTEAEKDLGVNQIDEICKKSTRYTYELKTHPIGSRV